MEAIILTKEQFNKISSKLDDLKTILAHSQSSSQDRIIDNAQFIKLMSISKRTAQNWRDNGKIGFSQIGNKIYYKLADIDALIEGNYNPRF